MLFTLLVLVIIAVIVVAVYSKEKNEERKKEGLEQAILQAHKAHNWDVVHDYCSVENIPHETMLETRKNVLRRLAEEGDLEAMNHMALDANTADERCKWLTRCAEAGDVEAMYTLAIGYMDVSNVEGSKSGFGVNPQKEFYWYQRAANLGHAKAKSSLVDCYFNGTGVEKDEEKAFSLAKTYSDCGNSECGCFLVRYYYCNPTNSKFDKAQGVRTLERIIARGEPKFYREAVWQLGYIYGAPYLYGSSEDEFSDRRKATYCFVLAQVVEESEILISSINKVGYDFTEFEYKKWYDDAKNLRYNPM